MTEENGTNVDSRTIYNILRLQAVIVRIPDADDPYANVEKSKTGKGTPVVSWLIHTRKILEETGKHMVVNVKYFGDAEPGDRILCTLFVQKFENEQLGMLPRIHLQPTPAGMLPKFVYITDYNELTDMAFFIAEGTSTVLKFQPITSVREAEILREELYDQFTEDDFPQ